MGLKTWYEKITGKKPDGKDSIIEQRSELIKMMNNPNISEQERINLSSAIAHLGEDLHTFGMDESEVKPTSKKPNRYDRMSSHTFDNM